MTTFNRTKVANIAQIVAALVVCMFFIVIIRVAGHDTPAAAPPPPSANAIRTGLAKVLPAGLSVDDVHASPVPALQEAVVGGRIVYVTNDGKYMLQGQLVELATKKNLTEASEAGLHRAELAKVGPDRRIEFPAADAKYRITVFTDVECAYCRALHAHVAEYNAQGITVDYLLYPRDGLGSNAYNTSVSVWCAPDRRQALTDAKLDKPVPQGSCTNPVADNFALGQRFGFPGTPAVYASDGTLIGGYLEPAAMRAKLDELATANATAMRAEMDALTAR